LTNADKTKKPLTAYIVSGAVVLVLAAVVLIAALSPPAPEKVVSGMLDSLAKQDLGALEKFVSPSVLEEMAALSEDQSRLQAFWQEGAQLFSQYQLGETAVSGDQAMVTVYYGPGLIQVEDFILRREGWRWRVSGLGD
jgi:hypothetical protein